MQTEIEAKFLKIDHDAMRQKLKELGANCDHPLRQMTRFNFDYPDMRLEKVAGWVRVRDEGDKVTLAYKQLNHRGVDGTKEVSIVVDSMENICIFLESIGLKKTNLQETRRESWSLDGIQIELDEWPWIKPFLEIEAPDEASLYGMIDKLGLNRNDALHGSVETAYIAEYDVTEHDIDNWPEIKFIPVPDWLEHKRKHI